MSTPSLPTTTATATGDFSTRNLIIILVVSISAAIILLAIATIFFLRRRRRRIPFLNRGISPIDDSEIESWKFARNPGHDDPEKDFVPLGSSAATMVNSNNTNNEGTAKSPEASVFSVIAQPQNALMVPRTARKKGSAASLVPTLPSISQEPATPPSQSILGAAASSAMPSPKLPSTRAKKPPSVIIYTNPTPPNSPPNDNPLYLTTSGSPHSKKSIDSYHLPNTPIQAIAPNARPGLTDETVEGTAPYLPSPKRPGSRMRGNHGHSFSNSSGHHRRTGSAFSFSGGGPGWKEQWATHSNSPSAAPKDSPRHSGNNNNASSNPFEGHRSQQNNTPDPYSDPDLPCDGANTPTPILSHSQIPGNVRGPLLSARVRALGHARLYSDVSMSPSFPMDEEEMLGGLSPRPSGKRTPVQNIGRALG